MKKERKFKDKEQKPNNRCPECGKVSYFPNAFPEGKEKYDSLVCSKKCGKKAGLTNEELEGD